MVLIKKKTYTYLFYVKKKHYLYQPLLYNYHLCSFIITYRKVVHDICYTILCDYVFVCVVKCVWNDMINTNCSLILYLRNCTYITKAIPYIETYQVLTIYRIVMFYIVFLCYCVLQRKFFFQLNERFIITFFH